MCYFFMQYRLEKRSKKIVENSGACVSSCSGTNYYKYEYLGKCYSTCPPGTSAYNNKCYPCDSNCKTCNLNSNTQLNTICTSCYSNKYLNNGKCVNSCTNGFYTSESDSSIKICKCENKKCKVCSSESLSKDLCISCNDNYYQKLNDKSNIGSFINCYTGKIDYYYLDNSNKVYKSCYSTCKTCDKNGNNNNHNCNICNSDNPLSILMNGYYNCYPKCDNYYYFNNEGNYICLQSKICPENFNKLIPNKSQCIDDCSKDSDYPYEFRNTCFKECPKNISYVSDTKNYFCEVNCTKENPLEIVKFQNCTNFCSINDMEDKKCISKYEDEETNANLILHNILKDINTTNFNKDNLYNNDKEIVIEEVYTKFTITTNKIIKSSDIQKVNLGNCENILKAQYNLDDTDNLVIFIIDINKDKLKENGKIVYEVYGELNGNNKLTKLDLNICNDTSINNEVSKCSYYSIESIIDNLCINCIDFYYPIYKDSSNKNSFIRCYHNPNGYYLDNEDKLYKKCYLSCESCDRKGNNSNHNCLSCTREYFYELNIFDRKNCYKVCPIYSYYNSFNNKYYCTNSSSCPKNISELLIPKKNQCIDDCSKDQDYPYQFRHTCFNECPKNISVKSLSKDLYCDAKCPKEYPFEMIETQNCVNNCTIAERQKGLCKINYEPENNEVDQGAEEQAIDNVKDELTNNFDTSEVDKGENVVIQQKGSIITISSSDSQKLKKSKNTTNINLGECEDLVKEIYNIPKTKSLYILKVDVKQDGLQIPKIEYEVYYPLFGGSLIKLNLTVCAGSKIDLSIPAVLHESLDIMNKSSNYYNDICYTYTSDSGTDISLEDRKKDFINNNLTVCEEDCDFSDYDYGLGKAICTCKVKTNSTAKIMGVTIDKDKLYNSFTDFKNIANVKVLKCYKLVFTIDAYKYNYANLILIFVIFLFLITFFYFCCKDYPNFMKIINIIIYFKTNPKVVKQFKKRKKMDEEKNRKKNITFKGNILTKRSRNKSREKVKIVSQKNSKVLPDIKDLPPPIFKQYLELCNANPSKKKKGSNNFLFNFMDNNSNLQSKNKNITNRFSTTNKTKVNKKIIINENKINIVLTKKELYEIFLKLSKYTDSELNNLPYEIAIKLDKRTYSEYYISLVKTKHPLFFSFWPAFDYNSRILKIFLFFFNFTLNFTVNALFFNDNTMHKIYIDEGSFNFIYNIPQILYSTIISAFVNGIINLLALSESNINLLRRNNNKKNIRTKAKDTIGILKIKFTFFFVINIALLVLFWFYLGCFCAVYKNTQIHLIKDTLISFGTSMIYPFGLFIIPGIFRIISLKGKNKNIMYNFSKIFELL